MGLDIEPTWNELLDGVPKPTEAELDADTMPDHDCTTKCPDAMADITEGLEQAKRREFVPDPRNKGGRPKGFNGLKAKMPSALAFAFKKAGLDWKEDFALAIKNNKRERIKLWLKLLPYMITTASSYKVRVKRWKGKPSKAAMIALEAMEDRGQ